jgi:hypothetical protein
MAGIVVFPRLRGGVPGDQLRDFRVQLRLALWGEVTPCRPDLLRGIVLGHDCGEDSGARTSPHGSECTSVAWGLSCGVLPVLGHVRARRDHARQQVRETLIDGHLADLPYL